MSVLSTYGLDLFRQYSIELEDNQELGRVISDYGSKYRLICQEGEINADLLGRLQFADLPEDQPKVGDWVIFMRVDDTAYIFQVLKRKNELFRKSSGKGFTKQVMATNIDRVAVVQSLDQDFNIKRLERYLAQMAACELNTVVILNKADLITDRQYYIDSVKRLQRDVPLFFCSTLSGEGIETIETEVFQNETTTVLLGSSGVGKSSLINSIFGTQLQEVKTRSEHTGKGRHTTTRRDLHIMPNGCLIIDTPGMREFGVNFDSAQHDLAFPLIAEISKDCRFRDCQHINEKACAVKAAVKRGDLDEIIYNSYLKMMKEIQVFSESKQEKKRKGKQMGKMIREVSNFRKKYKY
ncbi:MAG: ribosome small subunit-dependent GTPase A [Bacteroidales bacterium]